jgi:hypothetical protein
MAWSPPLGPEFEREHGVTESDWLSTLRGAVGAHPLQLSDGAAQVSLDALAGAGAGAGAGADAGASLQLRWQVLPPRVIALVRMPRLHVSYRFTGLSPQEQERFLRYFDLFMQRGGG